jgi:hypothetical protein
MLRPWRLSQLLLTTLEIPTMSTTTAFPDTSADPAPAREPSLAEILRRGLGGMATPIRDPTTVALVLAVAQANLTAALTAWWERRAARKADSSPENGLQRGLESTDTLPAGGSAASVPAAS